MPVIGSAPRRSTRRLIAAPQRHAGCGRQVRRRHCQSGRTSSSVPSAVTGTVPGRSRYASACADARVAVMAASTVSQACGRDRAKVAWARIFGHCGSASVLRRSTQFRQAELPGRTSGPTTPIASPVRSARCGTRSRISCPVRSGRVSPVRITRSGTAPSSPVLTSGAARSMARVAPSCRGEPRSASTSPAGARSAGSAGSGSAQLTCPTPEAARKLATHAPVRPAPCTRT